MGFEVDYDLCFKNALKYTNAAGELVRAAIKKKKKIETKSSARDLVTETDKAVEDLFIQNLAKDFPSHMFIGEETVASGEKCQLTDAPTWIIDPVDGTMNFVHSFSQTCISIALWVNKTAEIGIVYNAVLEHMYTARKGKGAFLNDERISVSGLEDIKQALVFTEMGTRDNAEKMEIVFNNMKAVMQNVQGVRFMGSAALDFCAVAEGACDAYYHIGLHVWDMAAGCLIASEAGAVVCDITGGEFDVMSRRLLCASSRSLADKISTLIQPFHEDRD